MILQQDSSRPKGLMVFHLVATTSMPFVQPGAKINADYYIGHDLHRLFPVDEEKKMIYHHDSAPSHTSKKTIVFLNET